MNITWAEARFSIFVRLPFDNVSLTRMGYPMEELLLVLAGILVYTAGLIFLLDALMPFDRIRITRSDDVGA